MARVYKVPAFPLVCNIWRAGAYPPVGPPAVVCPCQLRLMKTALVQVGSAISPPGAILLVVPKLTDIRSAQLNNNANDIVECPAGSGCYYQTAGIADAAKGFPNEYRTAVLHVLNYPLPHP